MVRKALIYSNIKFVEGNNYNALVFDLLGDKIGPIKRAGLDELDDEGDFDLKDVNATDANSLRRRTLVEDWNWLDASMDVGVVLKHLDEAINRDIEFKKKLKMKTSGSIKAMLTGSKVHGGGYKRSSLLVEKEPPEDDTVKSIKSVNKEWRYVSDVYNLFESTLK